MTTTYIIIGIVLMIGIQFVFPTALSSIMTGLTYGAMKAVMEAWAIRRKRIREERKANPRKPLFQRREQPAEPDTPGMAFIKELRRQRVQEAMPEVRRRLREEKPEPLTTTVVEQPGEPTIKVTANAEPLKPDTPTMSNDERQGLVRQWVRHRRGRGRHG